MTRDEWAQLEALFDEARQLAGAERAALLDVSGVSPETRRLVEQMLESYDTDPDFLEGSSDPAGAVDSAVTDALIGQRLGAYRIVQPLGRGGMGVVYEAVRDDDEFARRVAIKVLPAWGATALAPRFRLERRLLASLDHPGIARLIDSGTAPGHGLYFVMEYVDGAPIDEWARTRGLDADARVALLVRVADAVADAHRHLVVHRDLKPANILVQADGQPKLLDFGIATLLSDEGAESAGLTRTAERRFTPEFASPEQVRGEPVTTATDVYGLGALLYLLLSGRRPHDLRGASPLEAMRLVCEVDPPAPSHVASNVDAPRIRGALDAIVQKALRKAPRDRYTTVAALAADLRAWLAGQPVTAVPDTLAQQVWRFARRHAVGVAAGAAVVVALVAGGGVAVWQAKIADQERARAHARFNDVRRLANAVVGPLYDEIAKVPGSTEARRALVKEALAYLDRLQALSGDDLDLKSELAEAYQKIGDVQGNVFYANLGETAGAKASYTTLLRLRRDVFAGRPNDESARLGLAHAHIRDGDLALAEGRADDSIGHYGRALAVLDGTPSRTEARALTEVRARSGLGAILGQAGRHGEAIQQFETAIALIDPRATANGASEAVRYARLSTHSNLVDVLYNVGRYADAVTHAQVAVDDARRLLRDSVDVASARRYFYLAANRLAAALDGVNRVDDAIAIWNEAIAVVTQMAEADPRNNRLRFDLAVMFEGLAQFHLKTQRAAEALEAITTSFATWTVAFAADPGAKTQRFNYGMSFMILGDVQRARGNRTAATDAYREALAVLADPAVGARSPADRFRIFESLGDVLAERTRETPSAALTSEARGAYQAAGDGFADLAKAGQLPEALAGRSDVVAKKLARLPR